MLTLPAFAAFAAFAAFPDFSNFTGLCQQWFSNYCLGMISAQHRTWVKTRGSKKQWMAEQICQNDSKLVTGSILAFSPMSAEVQKCMRKNCVSLSALSFLSCPMLANNLSNTRFQQHPASSHRHSECWRSQRSFSDVLCFLGLAH